jgi:molybdenum cofactor cytidylyltransferase
MSVGCAILAAGASRRLGRPKQLVLFRGNELVRHLALEALRSDVDEVSVVLGAHLERVAVAVGDLRVCQLRNPGWREGIASSIRCAAGWALSRRFDALIVALCDQPHLDANHLNCLLSDHRSGALSVASRYGGVLGVPALFGGWVLDRLLTLSGDTGAAALLRSIAEGRSIEWPAGAVDIDTTRDLAFLLDPPAAHPSAVPLADGVGTSGA